MTQPRGGAADGNTGSERLRRSVDSLARARGIAWSPSSARTGPRADLACRDGAVAGFEVDRDLEAVAAGEAQHVVVGRERAVGAGAQVGFGAAQREQAPMEREQRVRVVALGVDV